MRIANVLEVGRGWAGNRRFIAERGQFGLAAARRVRVCAGQSDLGGIIQVGILVAEVP